MALVSSSIPNLANGVSQQAPSVRLNSQAEEQVNAFSSIISGLRKRPPSQNTDPIVELLKVLLKLVCKRENVAPKLLDSADDLEKIEENDVVDVKSLYGWRYDIFGKDAIALKNGEVAFAIKDGKIVIFEHK